MTWQSIATAPQDGEQCWVHIRHQGGQSTQAYAIWADGDWFMDVLESGDLYSRSRAIKDGMQVATVTHWMPLPPPPEDA